MLVPTRHSISFPQKKYGPQIEATSGLFILGDHETNRELATIESYFNFANHLGGHRTFAAYSINGIFAQIVPFAKFGAVVILLDVIRPEPDLRSWRGEQRV